MKVLIKTKEGFGGIDIQDLPIPSVGPQEVLVRERFAAICGTDLHVYKWDQWASANYRVPLPLGHEFSGEVVAVGCKVGRVKVGQKVVGETHLGCGQCVQCQMGRRHTCSNLRLFSKMGLGCFSEYTRVPEEMLRLVPGQIPFEQAAVLEPLGVSVRAVAEADVAGDDVLVVGCGPIGLFAVAAAKTLGATKIIATDVSKPRLDLARRVGADIVVDVSSAIIPDAVLDETDGVGIAAVIETSGNPLAIRPSFKALRPGGRIVMVGLPAKPVELDLVSDIITREAKVMGVYGRELYRTWLQVEKMLLSGKLDISPILTHTFSLDEYQEAFNLAASCRAGKILFKC